MGMKCVIIIDLSCIDVYENFSKYQKLLEKNKTTFQPMLILFQKDAFPRFTGI